MESVALVTGCSSGIGLETAIALGREGHFTYATMRDVKKSGSLDKIVNDEGLPIKVLELDVDSEKSVDDAIAKIMEEKGRVDTLINNAGWGMWGAVEDVSIEEFKQQFETNFFSIIRLIQKVAPIMRKQKSGNIVNVSSVAGKIGFPVSPAYISSKFALEGLSECIRFELGPFGINVIIIEPGVIKTNFFDSMKMAKKSNSDSVYNEITSKVVISLIAVTSATLWQKKISNNLPLSVSNIYQAIGGFLFHLFINVL